MAEVNKDDLRSTLRQRRIPASIVEDIMSHITTAHEATVTHPTELPAQPTQPRTVPRPIEPETQPLRPRPITRPGKSSFSCPSFPSLCRSSRTQESRVVVQRLPVNWVADGSRTIVFESTHSAVTEVPTRAPLAIPAEPKDALPTATLPLQDTATTTEVAGPSHTSSLG